VAPSGERLRRKGRHGVFAGKTVWSMLERFEIYTVYKRRYINTFPFLSFLNMVIWNYFLKRSRFLFFYATARWSSQVSSIVLVQATTVVSLSQWASTIVYNNMVVMQRAARELVYDCSVSWKQICVGAYQCKIAAAKPSIKWISRPSCIVHTSASTVEEWWISVNILRTGEIKETRSPTYSVQRRVLRASL